MTTPFIAAAAYILLTAQAPAHHVVAVPSPLQQPSRPCQLTMNMDPAQHPRHVRHVRHVRHRNHIAVRRVGWDRHHHRR